MQEPSQNHHKGRGRHFVGPYQSNLDYQFSAYGKSGSDSHRKLKAIKLPDLRGKRFLDLGCNAGFFCAFARDSGASDVLGVDKSEKIIAKAREISPDIRYLDKGWDVFPEGMFDVVICLSAIHYAANPIKLADEISEHLLSDGLFVLEGGLWGAEENLWSDILLPVWREVGDRVRHLSRGYVERHLLTAFNWELRGRSINQGGDLLNRYVVHARPGGDVSRQGEYRVCLVEYAKGLAISAPVIQEKQPAYGYVKELGAARQVTSETVERVLSDEAVFPIFIGDLAYAVGSGEMLNTRATVSDGFLRKVALALSTKNIRMAW